MPISPIIFKKASMLSDQHAQMLPVIIYTHCPPDQIREYILEEVGEIRYELPFLNAFSVRLPVSTAQRLASHTKVALIDDDARVAKLSRSRLHMTQNTSEEHTVTAGHMSTLHPPYSSGPSTKSSSAVGVAVLDTGIYPHYDLVKPYNRIIGFKDFVHGRTEPYDDDGHGTHIAGIISGNGYASMRSDEKQDNVIMGVAPRSNIIAVKVLDEKGNGNVSDILAGLQWVLDHKDTYNIKVVNISLGMPVEWADHGADPLAKGAAAAAAHGLCVVTAAGNSGPEYRTINSPGISPHVITVGAADTRHADSARSAVVAKFSSRGPGAKGLPKPDLSAPGVEIYSLSTKSPAAYLSESGTSMATPMVSGAAALLYEKNPALTPGQVKKILMYSTVKMHNQNRYSQGAGMVNIERALKLI